jgi:hypothetical protein
LYREHVMQLYDSGGERKSIALDYINEGLKDDDSALLTIKIY